MTTKQLDARFKAAGDAGSGEVRMLISSFTRTPDSYGDIIHEAAFDRTIKEAQEAGRIIPLNYGHVMDDPEFCIGSIQPDTLVKTSEGIEATAVLDLENAKARATHRLIKAGTITGVSIGFAVKDASWVKADGVGAYELRDIDLFEVSIVQVPANRDAQVLDVKAEAPVSRAEFEKLAGQVAALTANTESDDEEESDEEEKSSADTETVSVENGGAKNAELIKKHYGAVFAAV